MRSAHFTTRGRFEVGQSARPVPEADEILVDVHSCGICGSDLHYYSGEVPPPHVCPGHEICGRIAAGSSRGEVGLPVVVEPLRACMGCPQCLGGEPNLCPSLQLIGSRRPGGFADVVAVPATSIYPLPAGLDLDAAVLTEPLAVAVHGVRIAPPADGVQALVLGGGTIGLLTAFVWGRTGCEVTIAVRHPHQRLMALHLGATRVVEADRRAVLDLMKGRAPDVVFETVGGRADTLDLALEAVRAGGSIVALGVFTRAVSLHPIRFLAKEVKLLASMMYDRKGSRSDFATALELLRDDRDRLAAMITHRVPLEAIDAGFAAAADKRCGALKVCVDVGQKL